MSVMLLWLFQDTQGFVDVLFVNIILTCGNYPWNYVRLISCFYLFFFWLGKLLAAYSSKLTSEILTSTSGFFYMYIKLCYVFYCVFSSWDILLQVGPLVFCFSFIFNRTWPVFMVFMLYKPKRREAVSCKYAYTHRHLTLSTLFFFLSFVRKIRALLNLFHSYRKYFLRTTFIYSSQALQLFCFSF